ncbi:PEP-CTERM sorting domain-containing protein [Colwellia sp. BRX10-3]|uniref:PEP-CTERM sorting domain-containing protein n=1 Tax=Colwellia sp. BRX10-3 TaxID=2759844 RepID=UPI0015F6FB87|nr:PEP-CTERM sorting domain-containing protein [Colwellia sp. BRX10-3]MBA6389578.1 PEP-CTERM sorting domain-containing protein [Colwellia sp. BRX10-3]
MRALLFFKFILIFCLWSSFASASLIERNYLGIAGGITYDSETNFEWLDLTFTRELELAEYQDYLANLDAGWTFASSKLVSVLLTNFDFSFDKSDTNSYGTVTDYSEFYTHRKPSTDFTQHVNQMTILGESQDSESKYFGIKGFTSDMRGDFYEQYMAYYTTNGNTGIVSAGDYIRTPKKDMFESFFTYREAVAFQPTAITSQAVTITAIPVPEPTTLGLFSLFLCFMGFRKYKS